MPGWGLPAATGPRAAGCKRQALGERANTKTEQPLTDTRRRSRLPIHNHTHMRRHTRASRRPRLHAPHIPPRRDTCSSLWLELWFLYIHTYIPQLPHAISKVHTGVARPHSPVAAHNKVPRARTRVRVAAPTARCGGPANPGDTRAHSAARAGAATAARAAGRLSEGLSAAFLSLLARDVGTKTVSCVPSSTYSSETIVPTWHGGSGWGAWWLCGRGLVVERRCLEPDLTSLIKINYNGSNTPCGTRRADLPP